MTIKIKDTKTDENKKEWNQKIKNLGRDDLFEELDTKNLQKITSSPSSYPAIRSVVSFLPEYSCPVT